MNKKMIMMIVLGVVALALIGIKIAPLFLPRSMRMKMRAKKMGLPPPAPAPASTAPAPAPVPSAAPAPAPSTTAAPVTAQPISTAPIARVTKIIGLDDYFEPTLKRCASGYTFNELPNFFISRDVEETAPELLQVQLSITGILWDEENPSAIINNRIYSAGDWLDENIKILKIGQTFIIVTDEKEQRKFEIEGK